MKKLLYIVLFLFSIDLDAQDIFKSIEVFDTTGVKAYFDAGGSVDAVRVRKIAASSVKKKKKKRTTNLLEEAIVRANYTISESNPQNRISAFRNIYIILENIQKSTNREQLLARAFSLSISSGDIDLVRRIHQMGANIDFRCMVCYGRPPLLIALGYNENFELIKFLLSLKPDLTITDYDGKNALHYACQKGNNKIVHYIVENKLIDVNDPDNLGLTPLMYCAMNGDYTTFNFLVEHGADLKHIGHKGTTVLHAAAQSGDVDFFRHVHYVSGLPLWNKGWGKRDVYQETNTKEVNNEAIRLYIARYTIKQRGSKYFKKRKRKLFFKRIFS